MTFALVVKVKHGESMRRFNIYADEDGFLHLDLDGLTTRILNLLKISPGADVTLTYLDEDGDIITLADDYDLSDAIRQGLNPLRIILQLNQDDSGKSERSIMVPSKQSLQHVLSNMKFSLSEFLEFMSTKMPETLRRVTDSRPSRSSPSGSSSESGSDSSSETDSTPSRDSCSSLSYRSSCGSSSTPNIRIQKSDESINSENVKKDERFSCAQSAASSYHNNMDCPAMCGCAILSAGYSLPETPRSNLPSAAPGSSATSKQTVRLNRRTIHEGVQCKNCWTCPITGPRFKSRTKDDLDLCYTCFMSKVSNCEFVRLNHPDSIPIPQSAFMWPGNRQSSTHQLARNSGSSLCTTRFDSLFVRNITVVDGSRMKPGVYFTKIWRMFNSGTISWPSDTELKWIGGHKLTNKVSFQIASPHGVRPHDEIDIAIKFKAPQKSGRYTSYWKLSLPSGNQFGDLIWVDIQVVDPYEDYKLDLCSLQAL